jgi:hypothetical protein
LNPLSVLYKRVVGMLNAQQCAVPQDKPHKNLVTTKTLYNGFNVQSKKTLTNLNLGLVLHSSHTLLVTGKDAGTLQTKLMNLNHQTHYLNDKSQFGIGVATICYQFPVGNLVKKMKQLKFAKMAVEANPKDGRLQDNLKWLEENYVATQAENPS